MQNTDQENKTKAIIRNSELSLENPQFSLMVMNKIESEARKQKRISNLIYYTLMVLFIYAIIFILLKMLGIALFDITNGITQTLDGLISNTEIARNSLFEGNKIILVIISILALYILNRLMMNKNKITTANSILILSILLLLNPNNLNACSTFKLQKGNHLIYAHNLNQGDIGVPGMILLNKRGVYKIGRTWSELTTKDQLNPSGYSWISRYGSVTFNSFGRDLPDGGMNEEGLYIWEMNEDAHYPVNTGLPKLDQMNWMQYILDNYTTTEEAIACASEIEVSGWGWHYFVGDAHGQTAAIAFIDGRVVVHKGETMPVPGLFNTPYEREMEILKYYKGFGGQYDISLDDPQVPRFVKTAAMIRDYSPSSDIIDYGFEMLDKISVQDVPEWSVLFDARTRNIYFKTRVNPGLKSFSMGEVDFSNKTAVQILNMDISDEGGVQDLFHPYSNQEMRDFIENLVVPILPEDFFTGGGISLDEYLDRTSSHTDEASKAERQFFGGVWTSDDVVVTQHKDGQTETVRSNPGISLTLNTIEDRVSGQISNSKDIFKVEHISMIGNELKLTFRTNGLRLMEVKATITEDAMDINVFTTEEDAGSFLLSRSL